MYDMAKEARKAMKSKAQKMGGSDPHMKVDASSWSPDEPLNADIKTGLRPLSRRAFKTGGKVHGEHAKQHAGRMPRKTGGSAKGFGKEVINRDVKSANAERDGVKHIGGMKRGGSAHRKHRAGGGTDAIFKYLEENPAPAAPAAPMPTPRPKNIGINKPVGSQPDFLAKTPRKDWPSELGNSYKKGGKIKGKESTFDWMHSKEDAREDKILAKKHHMTPEAWEKSALNKKHDAQQSMKGLRQGGKVHAAGCTCSKCEGEHKKGGRVGKFGGGAMMGEAPKKAKKSAGKGHTHINIMVGAGHPESSMMGHGASPLGGPTPPPPAGIPTPMGGTPGMGIPPGAPPASPMGMPMGGGLPGLPPMGRKSGGRAYRSYKDMDAGSGSGKGRLEKEEIQHHKR